jgi:hypothetical protein
MKCAVCAVLLLQWALTLLNAAVLEDSNKLAGVLASSTVCLGGDCAVAAAKSFVAITANAVSLKVCGKPQHSSNVLEFFTLHIFCMP